MASNTSKPHAKEKLIWQIDLAKQQNRRFDLYPYPNFAGDRDVVLAAVAAYGHNLRFASQDLQNDREIVSEAVKSNPLALDFASAEMKGDREIVLAAVNNDGRSLEWASTDLKGDQEIVSVAVKSHLLALKFAATELKRDREIVLEAVNNNGCALHYASEESKGDQEIVSVAVKSHPWALAFASNELRGNRAIVSLAVTHHGLALEFAATELRRDREIVLEAVNNSGCALHCASEELRRDQEIVAVAVTQNGMALEFATSELKGDREIVLAAVKNDGLSLQHASEELRNDREVVKVALHNKSDKKTNATSFVLQMAGPALPVRGDRELVSLAIAGGNGSAIFQASCNDLKLDPGIVSLACEAARISNMWCDDPEWNILNSSLEKLYLQQLKSLQVEMKKHNKSLLKKGHLEDPMSMVRSAENWLLENVEKTWLAGEVISAKSVPEVLHSVLLAFTGCQKQIQVASKLLRFASCLCYVKENLDEASCASGLDFWGEFVGKAELQLASSNTQ